MSLNQNKKGATQLRGLKFIFALFGIAFMLILFYVWMQKNITVQAKSQAETAASEIELRIMFSDFIRTHGIDISSKTPIELQTILQKFSEKQISIDKGGYTAECSQKGLDKECELTIKLHENLGEILDWSLFGAGALALASVALPITAPALGILVVIKLIADKDLKNVEQETYLPVKGNKAMVFRLKTLVEFA